MITRIIIKNSKSFMSNSPSNITYNIELESVEYHPNSKCYEQLGFRGESIYFPLLWCCPTFLTFPIFILKNDIKTFEKTISCINDFLQDESMHQYTITLSPKEGFAQEIYFEKVNRR